MVELGRAWREHAGLLVLVAGLAGYELFDTVALAALTFFAALWFTVHDSLARLDQPSGAFVPVRPLSTTQLPLPFAHVCLLRPRAAIVLLPGVAYEHG